MKKTMKRLFTLVLALVLAMALAVPMFAADYRFYPTYSSNLYLNLYGNVGANYNMRRLTLYSTTAPGEDQRFTQVGINAGGMSGAYYIKMNYNAYGNATAYYAINKEDVARYDGYGAFMWPINYIAQEVNKDSVFCQLNNSEPLRLMFQDLGLAYTSSSNGAAVYFSETGSAWKYKLA